MMPPMRKATRRKDAEWALRVFERAPYVTVSMTRPDGTPYALPLSLVRRGKGIRRMPIYRSPARQRRGGWYEARMAYGIRMDADLHSNEIL